MSWVSISPLWLQKFGNSIEEYEDAFEFHPGDRPDGQRVYRLAVSDGATESSFAGIWAKQLVRSFCNQPFLKVVDLQDRISELSQRWHQIVFRRPLPWYAEEKARLGAFATLLGIELEVVQFNPSTIGKLRCLVIGDSCLFQVRENQLYLAVPVENSTEFGNSPNLLSSIPSHNQAIMEKVRFFDGNWQAGDHLFILTDALSAWFLREYEADQYPWVELFQVLGSPEPQAAFRSWAETRWANRSLKNDDLTCLVVQLS